MNREFERDQPVSSCLLIEGRAARIRRWNQEPEHHYPAAHSFAAKTSITEIENSSKIGTGAVVGYR